MTFDTRSSVVPLSVVLILLVAACRGGGGSSETRVTTDGGGGNRETGTTVFGLLAMMTNDGCTYQGDTSLPTGRFTVYLENHSPYDGSFGLVKPTDLEAYRKVRQRLKRGSLAPIAPPYKEVVYATVGGGEVSELPADVPAGSYVLVCLQETSPGALRALYLATQLEVSA